MKLPSLLLLAAGVTLALLSARSVPAQDEPLLPDLVTVPEALRDNYIQRKRGKKLLRFSNAITNVGDGALEVRGTRRGRTMPAVQRLFTAGGGYQDVPFGAFEYHLAHRHWHLAEVARYRLLTLEGSLVAESGKISFCLMDEEKLDPAPPNTPERRGYHGCPTNRKARRLRAGISVGWVDIYEATKPGQQINITNVPPGEYLLQSQVNPGSLMREKDLENNTATVPVVID